MRKGLVVFILCAMGFLLVGCFPGFAAAQEPDTVENGIREALIKRTSFIFEIADDHKFLFDTDGNSAVASKNEPISDTNGIKSVENSIKEWSAGEIIRIDHGVVTMDNSAYYNCRLAILEDELGIALMITTKDGNSFNSEISGVISGNTLTAAQSVVTSNYNNGTDHGIGSSFAASYCVSVIGITEDQYPPQAVALKHSIKLDTALSTSIETVTLQWADHNAPERVAYYEVYRIKGVGGEAECMATVPAGTYLWTDEDPGTLLEVTAYYVIAYSPQGVAGEQSNSCVF